MKITGSDTQTHIAGVIQAHDTTTSKGCQDAALELWGTAQGWHKNHGDIEITQPAKLELLEKTCLLLITAQAMLEQG